ncbi:hypothetical protein L3Y34_017337 [Caenorhabditis briggsae]|uniref:Uncharacterized protein n=1 Tax=Caenorhabditis briggsae TaxID=6238 RepID=A0AAE9ITM4_CAEBR|nr:hypothetical protein L3Y34_017337 [Caenorhabditis briggsae]
MGGASVGGGGNQKRFTQCSKELEKLLQEDRLSGAPLLLLANKCDLPAPYPAYDLSHVLDIPRIREERSCQIFNCSAISGELLVQAMTWLCDEIM